MLVLRREGAAQGLLVRDWGGNKLEDLSVDRHGRSIGLGLRSDWEKFALGRPGQQAER